MGKALLKKGIKPGMVLMEASRLAWHGGPAYVGMAWGMVLMGMVHLSHYDATVFTVSHGVHYAIQHIGVVTYSMACTVLCFGSYQRRLWLHSCSIRLISSSL